MGSKPKVLKQFSMQVSMQVISLAALLGGQMQPPQGCSLQIN